ncbi:NAD(P)H-binding protein, partial [bacterium]|nr:NAD(P)H-binding protein [bacterium]
MKSQKFKKPILVLGGTGHYGQFIVRSLMEKQVPVRVLSRNPVKAQAIFNEQVEIIKGDILDINSLKKSLEDISGLVITISAMTPQLIRKYRVIELEAVKKLIDLIKEREIRRVIYISVFDPTHSLAGKLKLESAKIKKEVEEYIATSNLNWTVFGAPPSQEIFFAMLRNNKLIIPGGGPPKLPTISPIDVGEIVAQAILREDLSGKRFRLVGPDLMSFQEAAERIGAYLNKKIKVVKPPLLLPLLGQKILFLLRPFSKTACFAYFM